METEKKNKVTCPNCKGNGYIRVPYKLAKEEVTAQCGVCNSQGEVNADEVDDIVIDADGIHRLQ
jgi:DnaJ-class molecular chaperone|tara:strand:+ start:561 stop:752 length:192 start_codon:yes stop_codon:yes gene_type:complete